jgi:small-conductance mechanosensitive channel
VEDLVKTVTDETFLVPPFGRIAVVIVAFVLAWFLTKLAGRIAAFFIDRSTKVGPDAGTAVLDTMKQRETAISLVQTTVRYVAFGIALLFAILVLTGAKEVGAVVGASFFAVVLAFAAQRFLMDVIAGVLMFIENWFKVGDTVAIEPHGGEGVVEEVALRYTTLRAANGEVVKINNSTIAAARVTPRGRRELDVELFTKEEQGGRELVEDIARVVPVGPTHFIRRPKVEETEKLDDDLVRIKARASVAPGREWLADELLPDLIKEKAGDDLLVHGPVVSSVDELAARRFARAAYGNGGGRRDPHRNRSRLARLRTATERMGGRKQQ